jgi:RNA recognition motif-containing protein
MNMYVSNLNYQTTDDELRKLFAQFGTVTSAKVIMDRDTGRSRGFGFVEMESEKDANEAMKKLNQKEFEGKVISVSVAREKPARDNNRRW